SQWEVSVGLGTSVTDCEGRGFTGGGMGWFTSLVCGVVFGLMGIYLGNSGVEELAMEGLVGLTTLLEGSGFLALGCTFLGKGDMGVWDVEGKADGGRG
ncbi:hypothetical protein KI387_028069, partial [Taxus chinensis]